MIPETVASPISAFLVVESNGGERRVEVRLEPVSIAKSEDASIFSERPEGLFDFLQHWTMARRIAMAASFAFGTRAVLSIIDGLMPSTTPRESFVSSLLVFMLIGPVLGGVYGLRKEGPGALVPAVLASGFAAIFFSTILQSLRRAIDVPLGTSVVVSCLVWTVLGIVVAVLSRLCIPPRPVPLRWSVEKSRS